MRKKSKSKKNNIYSVLIVNLHSSLNTGDYALFIQTIHYIKEAFGNVIINALSNWPKETQVIDMCNVVLGSPWREIGVWNKNKKPRFQVLSLLVSLFYLLLYRLDFKKWFEAIIPKQWQEIFSLYEQSDLIVAVSGNQLFSSGRLGWPLPVIGYPIYLAKTFKKNILIFPQSVGPLKTKFEECVVKYLYNNVTKLYIRDFESLKLIKKLNIEKSEPSFMPDVAFTLPPSDESKAKEILSIEQYNHLNKNIGLTIISNMPSYLSPVTMQNYYDSIAKAIEELTLEHNFEIYIFCQVYGPTLDENDFVGIERVTQRLNPYLKDKIHIIDRKLHPSELKACYGLMDLFIASRLHSGIFALGMGVPTLFIGYLYKTIGVLEAMNLSQHHISLEELSDKKLVYNLIDMWDRKNSLENRIAKETKQICHQLSLFPQDIRRIILKNDN